MNSAPIRLLIASLFIVGFTGLQAQYQYLGTYNNEGKPNYLLTPADIVSASFRNTIATTLPEYRPVPIYNPILIAAGRTETIDVNCPSDVWISFVDEGATFRNALGFYTFNTDNPPTTAPAANQIKIIFPNASKGGFGGGLTAGDKVFLGNFPAKTGIGFVLMADGWDGTVVQPGNWTLYSNSKFNPEAADSLKKHTVIVRDTLTNRLIIGFEDVRRDNVNCDHDFNDLLFFATIIPINCVRKLDSIPNLSENGEISFSGNTGGLESKGLGDKIAKRVLQKILNGTNGAVNYAKMEELGVESLRMKSMSTDGGLSLRDIMPSSIPEGNYKSFVTTPADIPGITNAIEVRAVDFTQDNITKAVAFATKTLNLVYDHTKPICDRLKGAVLMDIDHFKLKNLQFVRYALKQETGHIEYSMSFVIGKKAGRNSFSFQSNWLNADYAQEDTLYNYQVWGVAPYLCVDMALNILEKLNAIMPVVPLRAGALIPTTYIRSGNRDGFKINLQVENETTATTGYFEIEEKANELSSIKTKRIVPFTLLPKAVSPVTFPMNDTYESNIAMFINGKLQDVVYMSDGTWDIAYDSAKTVIQNYIITNDTIRNFTDIYPVFRDVQVKASTDNYVTVYKLLRGAGAPQNLTAHKTINFKAKGNTNLRITLVKNSITDFAKQFSYKLPVSKELTEYNISLADFKSKDPDQVIKADDITTIVFSFENSTNTRTTIDAVLADIAFSKKSVEFITTQRAGEMQLYPNPASNGKFYASFRSEVNTTATLKVINAATGKILLSNNISVSKGDNVVPVQINSTNAPAMLMIKIDGKGINFAVKKIVVNGN